MNAIKNVRNVVVAGLLAFASACMGASDNAPAISPAGTTDASVSACCTVDTPVNQILPTLSGGGTLRAVQVPGGTISFGGKMTGGVTASTTVAQAQALANRIMVLIDVDTDGVYDAIMADTGPTFDPAAAGNDTDPDAGAITLGAASNDGVSLATMIGNIGADNCTSAAGTAAATLPAAFGAAFPDGTTTAGITWGMDDTVGAAAPCVGARVTVSGSAGRSWQSANLVVGDPIASTATFKVVFLNSAGNLLDSNSSVTFRGDALLGYTAPNTPAVPPRLSDILVSSDTLPAAFTAAPGAPATSGIVTIGTNQMPLPFGAVSWYEINTDLSVSAFDTDLTAAERNLRSSGVDAGDVVVVSSGNNIGKVFVTGTPTGGPAGAHNANNSPSVFPLTDAFSYAAAGETYQIFHGSVLTDREREDGLAPAVIGDCTTSPNTDLVDNRCATDVNFNFVRAASATVQGTVDDAPAGVGGSNISQIIVHATNSTTGLSSEQGAIVNRDTTKQTYAWGLAEDAAAGDANYQDILLVAKTAGVLTTTPCVTLSNNAGTVAVTQNAAACASGGDEYEVDLDAIVATGATPPESMDGDIQDVVNTLNIGRPASEQFLSQAANDLIRYTSAARTAAEAGAITIQYVNSIGDGAGEETNPALGQTTVSVAGTVITVELGNTLIQHEVAASVCPGDCPIAATANEIAGLINSDIAASNIILAQVLSGAAVAGTATVYTNDSAGAVNPGTLTGFVPARPISADGTFRMQQSVSTQGCTDSNSNGAFEPGTDAPCTAGVTGTINYTTGAYSIIFPAAFAAAEALDASFNTSGRAIATAVSTLGVDNGAIDQNELAAETSVASAVIRASLVNGADGSVAAIASATAEMADGTDVTVNPLHPGRLTTTNPKIMVGMMDIYRGAASSGLCLPSFLNARDAVAAAVTTHDVLCIAANLALNEGRTTFTVDVVDAAGNVTQGASVGQPLVKDTAPAFINNLAGTDPGAPTAVRPAFCDATGIFDAEPVCVTPARVDASGSYSTFANTVRVGARVRDFTPGTTTFNTTANFTSGTNAQGDSGRVYVRLVSDAGFDSFDTAAWGTVDNGGNPVPYVNGDEGDGATTFPREMGEFEYANIPLRAGGVTNFSVTLWDQTGNISSFQFTVQQIAANTETAPSLSIDCAVDNLPRTRAGALTNCEDDFYNPANANSGSRNPNAPINMRRGVFGDVLERVPLLTSSQVIPGAPGALAAVAAFPILPFGLSLSFADNGETCSDDGVGALVCTLATTGTVTYATGVITFTAYDAGLTGGASVVVIQHRAGGVTGTYNNNFVSELSYATGGVVTDFVTATGLRPYLPPIDQRLIASDKVSLSGRYLTLDNTQPTLFINGVSGLDVSFLPTHGYEAGVYDFGFLSQVAVHVAGDNCFDIVATAGQGTPADNAATERDEQLRVGDWITLSSLDASQAANVGLYKIVALTNNCAAAAACDATVTECFGISVDRPLPQDASAAGGMFVQAEYIWFTPTPLALPDEGVNAFTFVAIDALGNQRSTALSFQRDFQPPSLVIEGILDSTNKKFSTFSVTPEIFITDSSLFMGGANAAGACLIGPGNPFNATCLTNPLTYIAVSRTDSNGVDTQGDNYETGYALLGDQVNTAGPDPVAVSYDASDDDNDADPFTIPAGDAAPGGAIDWPAAVVGAPSLAPSTVLGTAKAVAQNDPVATIPPDTLDGDASCDTLAFITACPAGQPMSYHIEVYAADRVGFNSQMSVSADVREAAVDRLLAGALGILSGNPAVINLLSDNTELRILTMDQLSLSGVLYNSNLSLSKLLGSPSEGPADNEQAWFYINNGSRDDFGLLVGTILNDPDGSGPGQATGVTLMNVIRILADNGVLDDLLPIIDNTNILSSRVGALDTRTGDMSRSNTFLRNLLVDTASINTSVCGAGEDQDGGDQTCFSTEGIIKEAFPTIKAVLDFGDILANAAAGAAPRTRTLNAANLNSRYSGDTLDVLANSVTDAAADFIPMDSTNANANAAGADATNCAADNLNLPVFDDPIQDAICRSVVNVQPDDIVVIRTGVCDGVARRVAGYADSATPNTLPTDAASAWPAACVTACDGTPGNCFYEIVHTNGPSLNPVIELVDLLSFGVPGNGLDNQAGGAADNQGGERELFSALFHMMEDGMHNDPGGLYVTAGFTGLTNERSLICPQTNGATGNDNCVAATVTDSIDDAESLQAVLDLVSELSDDDNNTNGIEFISRLINLINALLRVEPASAVPAQAQGSSFLEAMIPLLTDLLDDGNGRKTGVATTDLGGLLTTPFIDPVNPLIVDLGTPGTNRQNTRLNLLMRSMWWMAQGAGTASDVDLNGNGMLDLPEEYTTNRPLVAMLPLLRAITNDPDDNPRGIFSTGAGAPVLVPPGSNTTRSSIFERLVQGPVDLVLNDSRLSQLIGQLGSLLDPGTGVSDLAIFQNAGTVSEYPFTVPEETNPYNTNPPLLRILSEISSAQLDVDVDGVVADPDDESATKGLTDMLNALLEPIGPDLGAPVLEDVNQDNDGAPVNTDVCNEGFFAGRTPVEVVLNVVSQMLETASKDPKDYDLRDRNLPDFDGTVGNRSLLRAILDGLFDDPAVDESSLLDNVDEYPLNPLAGTFYNGVDNTSGTRGPNGGDRLNVAQGTLDILPELLNTMQRFGFDDNDPAEPLTSIFRTCGGGGDCRANDGYPGATDRILSAARTGIDIALQLDAPFQIGAGATCGAGLLCFEESATREFLESISNLDNAQAVNQILVLMDRLEEDIRPFNSTTSIPNPKDVSRAASAVRAMADADGDGVSDVDAILDDLIPLIQVIPASGLTQQILDMIRGIRGCGYTADPMGGAEPVDIRGGRFLKVTEDTTLAMLDAYSGAQNILSIDGGTAECPAVAATGATGGILDSNPLFPGQSPSNRGVIAAGSRAERPAAATTGQLRDPSKNFRDLGVGPGADICIRSVINPFTEICEPVTIRPAIPPAANLITYAGGVLDAFTAANCPNADGLNDGPYCSYRVRQMREPYNGCIGGVQIPAPGVGFTLSSFSPIGGGTPNNFRDSRLDLLLRSMDCLADGDCNGTAAGAPDFFLDRLEGLLSSAVQDNPVSGEQSIAKTFLFGAAGVQSTEEGPIQSLLNDDEARAALTSFLTLFGQLTVMDTTGAPDDYRDRYPDFKPGQEWAATSTPCNAVTTACDGNAIHDAVDYQFLALQGILNVLGDADGLDNFACNIFGRNGMPRIADSTITIQDGHCDDPDVLFFTGSLLIQAGLVKELIPGLQIIVEATNAQGNEQPLVVASPPFPAPPAYRDLRLNTIRANEVQINREALADILQRASLSANGDYEIFDFLDDGVGGNASFAGVYPEDYLPVNRPNGAIAGTAGILEGPQQILVRAIAQMLYEYVGEDTSQCTTCTVDDQLGYGTRRNRVVAFEELVSRISGARDSANLLNQALRILRGITEDKDGVEASVKPRLTAPVEVAGETEGVSDGATQRDIGPLLSVNAGLVARSVVDASAPFRTGMDVIGDFLQTLIEDPTDCNTATLGIIDRNVASGVTEGACPTRDLSGLQPTYALAAGGLNYSVDVDSVFRDVGVTVERPIQPVFTEDVFDSLSSLFAGGDQATIVGALPFLGAFLNEQLGPILQRPFPLGAATPDFLEYDYCTVSGGCTTEDIVADALLADLQALIPNDTGVMFSGDLLRFDPLLTDDVNRNGQVGDAGLVGTGASSPTNDLDFDAVGTIAETDNVADNCDQGSYDGNPANDWGSVAAFGARCGTTNIGFTALDGVVTISGIDGFDAALIDGLGDLIANEDSTRAVNNQSNRTNTGRETDTFTQRTVNPTQAVDPNFVDLVTALGDLLIATNSQ